MAIPAIDSYSLPQDTDMNRKFLPGKSLFSEKGSIVSWDICLCDLKLDAPNNPVFARLWKSTVRSYDILRTL